MADLGPIRLLKSPIGLGEEAAAELSRALSLHGPMHGPHEGYAVLLEEVDELWDEVRKRHPDPAAMRKEAIQIAAMALRFVYDVCDREDVHG